MGSFWRKELPEVDPKTGLIIKGGMWQHQRDWWEATNFIKALVAGYGSGKTLISGKRAISVSLHNAPSPYLYVSPSYKIAKKTIVPTIKGLLDGKMSLVPGLSYKYNKTDMEFRIWYKGLPEALIWIQSGEDPDSLKGPNVGAANIDEPFIQSRDVFEQCLARVRDPRAKLQELNLTGTPEEFNWGYDVCEGEDRDNYDLYLRQASTVDNKALPPAYAERLMKSLTPEAAAAFLQGHFVSLATGRIYYGFSKERNVMDLPDPGTELCAGMDFNVNPMASVVFWKSGNHIHFMDEIELENADTEFMCDTLLQRYTFPSGEARIRDVYPDATGRARRSAAPGGKSDFWYIRNAGMDYHCGSANPHRRDRYNAANGKLNPKEGPVTMTVSPKCKKLIQYFQELTYADLKKKEHMTHLTDAATYPVARLFPVHQSFGQMAIVGT